MKRGMFFWFSALMICIVVGCTDNANFEPETESEGNYKYAVEVVMNIRKN